MEEVKQLLGFPGPHGLLPSKGPNPEERHISRQIPTLAKSYNLKEH